MRETLIADAPSRKSIASGVSAFLALGQRRGKLDSSHSTPTWPSVAGCVLSMTLVRCLVERQVGSAGDPASEGADKRGQSERQRRQRRLGRIGPSAEWPGWRRLTQQHGGYIYALLMAVS